MQAKIVEQHQGARSAGAGDRLVAVALPQPADLRGQITPAVRAFLVRVLAHVVAVVVEVGQQQEGREQVPSFIDVVEVDGIASRLPWPPQVCDVPTGLADGSQHY